MIDVLVYLVIMPILAGVLFAGLTLGDTDDVPPSYSPGQIHSGMRGLRPWPRLRVALAELTHALANGFVEGLVVLGVGKHRSRPLGRWLAVMFVVSVAYGFWLLAHTPN